MSLSDIHKLRRNCLRHLLRPVVRYCLKNSQSAKDAYVELKRVFVEEAERELKEGREKVNYSRLSVLTGLHRPDIKKIREEKEGDQRPAGSLLSRIVGQWEQDPSFCSKAGHPRVLNHKGSSSEFESLVHSVSTDLNPGTILFELIRTGTAVKTNRGVKLVRQLPDFTVDPERAFELLSRDIQSMIEMVEENMTLKEGTSNLHIRTEYDNIFQSDLPDIRKWLVAEGKAFHRRVRDFLSLLDKDVNRNPLKEEQEAGARVVVTAFSLTDFPDYLVSNNRDLENS